MGGFWEVWAHHHHSGKVGGYLEELRIGRLVEGEEVRESGRGGNGTNNDDE